MTEGPPKLPPDDAGYTARFGSTELDSDSQQTEAPTSPVNGNRANTLIGLDDDPHAVEWAPDKVTRPPIDHEAAAETDIFIGTPASPDRRELNEAEKYVRDRRRTAAIRKHGGGGRRPRPIN